MITEIMGEYLYDNLEIEKKKKILIVGYGWGTQGFLSKINRKKYDITVLTKDTIFSFTPGLHHHLDMPELFNRHTLTKHVKDESNVNHIIGELKDVDFYNKMITFSDYKNRREPLSKKEIEYTKNYDYIVFAYGADINDFGIEGVKKHCYTVKNMKDIEVLREQISEQVYKYKTLFYKEIPEIVIIGCGPLGIELLGSLVDLNKNNDFFKDKMYLYGIDALNRPLQMFREEQSEEAIENLKGDVKLFFDSTVKKIDEHYITLKNTNKEDNKEIKIPYDIAVWCGGVKPNPLTDIIYKSKLNRGLLVTPTLQLLFPEISDTTYYKTQKDAFALGDCVDKIVQPIEHKHNQKWGFYEFPKTGQVAFQQGQYLAVQFNRQQQNNSNAEPFEFSDKGQFCYIGKSKSLYNGPYFSGGGYITAKLNNIVLAYNMWKSI